jgi:hypothetical protein
MTNGIDQTDSATNDAEGRACLLHGLETAGVYAVWQKALERRHTDPEGAITSARTLLETVCRHVLDERGIAYSQTLDLPVLMKMAVEQLDLASPGTSQIAFKRVLGSVASVVEELSSADHNRGKASTVPSARHAQLAANMAGAAAIFIIEAWEARVEEDFLEMIDDSKGG